MKNPTNAAIPSARPIAPIRRATLDELTIDDEGAFRHVGLYAPLKETLRRDGYGFRVLEGASWDRALFLNLTYWSSADQGDVLTEPVVPADVVMHVAWHHLARRALGEAAATADGLFFGEAVASAFDLFLVGRLLGHAPDSAFLETQVPALAAAAENAGLSSEAFEALLEAVAADPDRAFEDLRELLFEVPSELARAASADDAAAVLERADRHRFAPLLHHFEIASWVLYAKAHAGASLAPSPSVRALDEALRSAPNALDWLEKSWLDR